MNISSATNASQISPGGINTPVTTYKQFTSALTALQTANPSEFASFAANAASEFQAAAQNAQGRNQDFLNYVGNMLQNAASNPSAPLPTPTPHAGNYLPRLHPAVDSLLGSITAQATTAMTQLSS